MAALARREHSRRELERKLGARGIGPETIAATLDDLAARGLQDDERFAASYLRMRAERGYGPRRITAELRERGVEAAVVNTTFAAAAIDFDGIARAVRERKFRGLPRSLPERAKQTRFLEYRGFAPENIRHALASHGETDERDEDF